MSAQYSPRISSEPPSTFCLQFLLGKRVTADKRPASAWGCSQSLEDLMLHFSNSPQSIQWKFLVKMLCDKSVLNCNCNLLFKNTHISEVYKSSGWTSAKPSFALQPLCFPDLNYPQLPSLYSSDIYEIYSQCVLCLLAAAQHYSHYQIPLSVITQSEGKVQARWPDLSAKKKNVFSSCMLQKSVVFSTCI